MFDSIGFIGCGNMGGALLRALAGTEAGQARSLFVSGKGRERAEALANRTGAAVSDNRTIAARCSMIFLGVKPQVMPAVLAELRDTFAARADRFVLVSMAAGLTTDAIRSLAGGAYPIIRIMPNLPVSIGAGTTLVCAADVDEKELAAFAALMAGSGALCPVPEAQMDAAGAISGCGPAFAALFVEALADGGVACGLPRETAQLLAAQTVAGSAELLARGAMSPAELKDRVCSPGGTTIEGVLALEDGGFRSLPAAAVRRAYDKTKRLAKG